MFICTELIEGTRGGLILGIQGYFWSGANKFE